jgi:hypothetical protein
MAEDRAALLAEAYRRGLLPPDQKAAYEEARRRGIVAGGQKANPSMGGDFMRPIKEAGGRLVEGVKADYARSQRIVRGEENPNPLSLGPGPRAAGNALAVPLAVAQGAVEATVSRPVARAAIGAGLPVYERRNALSIPKAAPNRVYGQEAEDIVAGDIGLALGGAKAGPVRAARPAPKPAPKPAPRMNAEGLKTATGKAYEAAENAGVRYKPAATDSLVQGIADDMVAARLRARRHPNAASVLEDDIMPLKGTEMSLEDLDELRQVIRSDVIESGTRSEQRLGKRMLQNIDEFIAAAGPDQVTAGDAVKGAQAIKTARDLNTRYRKLETVEEALDMADLRTGATGSGGNIDNATRQRLTTVLKSGNWTADEEEAFRAIIKGGKAQNFLRLVGKLSPTGNGLMTALNIGGAASNPLLAIPGVAGIIAKMRADAMTAKKVQELMDLIASGGAQVPKTPKAPVRVPNVRPVAAGGAAANALALTEDRRNALAAR